MNAVATRWEPEQVRLWTGSALAALLVHLAVAALFFLRLQWPAPPAPLAGTPAALDVILASPPSSVPAAPSSSLGLPLQSRQEQSPSKSPELPVPKPLQPLTEVQPISERVVQTHSNAAPQGAAVATGPAPELSPLATPDLLVLSQTEGQVDVPLSPAQQWLAQIKALLERYKEYPSSARKKAQHDIVGLEFSVDPAGKLTYVRIGSPHHYRALEQEVRRMLRQASPLPAPPPQVPVDKIVWSIPVDFKISFQTPSSALIHCFAPENPGRAPSGATATLQQMRAYRNRLNQYVVAGSNQLACLILAPGAIAMQSRKTLIKQLHALVDNFNAQAQLFESHVQAEALQAQQARERQVQAFAVQAYATCTSPSAARAPPDYDIADAPPAPGSDRITEHAQAYRRELVGYQSAVRSYVVCLRQLITAAPFGGLPTDQRAQLDQTALQLGNAAIVKFNQVAGQFNAQVTRLNLALGLNSALATKALQNMNMAGALRRGIFSNNAQEQQNLAEALVRGSRIFPSSTWDLPTPFPEGECFRITQFGRTYQVQVCQSTYFVPLGGVPVNGAPGDAGLARATQQEQIAAIHGVAGDPGGSGASGAGRPVLGIAEAPLSQAGQQTGTRQQAISYNVSELQVNGRHISMTITARFDSGGDSRAMHFDLVLSPDTQALRGYCWTGNQRSECTLTRHPSASDAESSRH